MLIWIGDYYQRSFSSFSSSHLFQSVGLLFSVSISKRNFFEKLVNVLDCALFSCLLYSAKLLYYRMCAKTHQLHQFLVAQWSTAHQGETNFSPFQKSSLLLSPMTFQSFDIQCSGRVRLELKVEWLFKRSKIIQLRRSESIAGQLVGFSLFNWHWAGHHLKI